MIAWRWCCGVRVHVDHINRSSAQILKIFACRRSEKSRLVVTWLLARNRIGVDEYHPKTQCNFSVVCRFAEGLSHKTDLVFSFRDLGFGWRMTSSFSSSRLWRALENSDCATYLSMFTCPHHMFAHMTKRARRWHPGFLTKEVTSSPGRRPRSLGVATESYRARGP